MRLDMETADEANLHELSKTMEDPMHVFDDKVILELKFTDRYPNWFRELVRVFGLMQCGAAKYVDGVARKGTHLFHFRPV